MIGSRQASSAAPATCATSSRTRHCVQSVGRSQSASVKPPTIATRAAYSAAATSRAVARSV